MIDGQVELVVIRLASLSNAYRRITQSTTGQRDFRGRQILRAGAVVVAGAAHCLGFQRGIEEHVQVEGAAIAARVEIAHVEAVITRRVQVIRIQCSHLAWIGG